MSPSGVGGICTWLGVAVRGQYVQTVLSFCGRFWRLNPGCQAWQHHLHPVGHLTSLYVVIDKKASIKGGKYLYLKSHPACRPSVSVTLSVPSYSPATWEPPVQASTSTDKGENKPGPESVVLWCKPTRGQWSLHPGNQIKALGTLPWVKG